MWRPLAWWILTWAALYNTPGYPVTSDLSHLILSVLTGEGDNVDKKVWTSIHLFYPSPTYFLWKLFTKINWADYWMKLILGLVDSTIKAKDYEVIEGPDCNVVRNDDEPNWVWRWNMELKIKVRMMKEIRRHEVCCIETPRRCGGWRKREKYYLFLAKASIIYLGLSCLRV